MLLKDANKTVFISTGLLDISQLVMQTGFLLAKIDKKVLIIDTTVHQTVYYNFKYNELEENNSLSNLYPFSREDVDILSDKMNGNLKTNINFERLDNFDVSAYDYVIVIADETINLSWLKGNTINIVFNSDYVCLIKNQEILERLKDCEYRDIIVIYYNFFNCKLKRESVFEVLNRTVNRGVLLTFEDIEVPFNIQDYTEYLNSRLEGYIDPDAYKKEYKSSLLNILNTVFKLSKEELKQLK